MTIEIKVFFASSQSHYNKINNENPRLVSQNSLVYFFFLLYNKFNCALLDAFFVVVITLPLKPIIPETIQREAIVRM